MGATGAIASAHMCYHTCGPNTHFNGNGIQGLTKLADHKGRMFATMYARPNLC